MTMEEWMPLIGITVSAFIFNTSEFMPVGLLTDIADTFSLTEASAGMLITVYAWFVMLLSLPLMLVFCKTDLRKLLLGTLALFCGGQVLSCISTGYGMLMLSRIAVAAAHAVFWSIASPAAVRVVAPEHRSLALSTIVTGTSVAMICGLPLGRLLGIYAGWRVTFLCVGVISFVIMIYLALIFPKLPPEGSFSVRQLPGVFRNRALTGIYILTFMLAGAHYIAYSYIEPFLKQIAGLSDSLVTVVLTVFGAAGIIGSILFSRFYDRTRFVFMKCILIGIAAAQLLLMAASASFITSAIVCALWGMAITAFNVTFQAETIKAASAEGSTVAMSIYSGIYNLGISVGTWVGGLVCTYVSISYIGIAGGITACAAFIFCSLYLISHLKFDN